MYRLNVFASMEPKFILYGFVGQREVEPFGLNGGCNGSVGRNCLLVCKDKTRPDKCRALLKKLRSYASSLMRTDGMDLKHLGGFYRMQQLLSRDSFQISAGDVLLVQTPGGGGFGTKN